MRTFTFLAAFMALLSLTSAQSVCSPTLTCSAALSAVNIPTPYYSLNFSSDPRPAGAVYSWNTAGANETGCPSAPFHQGVLVLTGASHDSSTLGPSVNLTAPFGQPNSISTPLPITPLFGTGTSLGNVAAGTAGWSVEVTFKAYNQQGWAKVFDFGLDGVGVSGGGGGHYDVLLGWNGGNNYMSWTVDAANALGAEITSAINPVAYYQWYHALLVWQETSAGLANWVIYVNGVQTAYMTNAFFPPAVIRKSANLGRSDWTDSFFQGEIDTFNIYQWAMTPSQAMALASQAMGGCTVTYASAATLNAPMNSTVPAALFDASFGSDPRAAAGGADAANYGWTAQDADDVGCGLSTQHQGLLRLNGQYTAGNPVGGYVNLSANSGVDSIGQTLPTLGGLSAGTLDQQGMTLEITFKNEVVYPGAKLFDIAAPQNASGSNGPCMYDILFGFNGNSVSNGNQGNQPSLQFDICDGNGNENSMSGWGALQLGTWYHVALVVQQLSSGQAMYTGYINGVRAAIRGNSYYPAAVPRSNGDMGKSSWSVDNYWGGLIDSFRIYNYALNPAQVQTLSTSALGSAGTLRCPQTTAGLPSVVPSDALIYSLDFNQDPRSNAGGAANAVYNWVQTDPLDTTADQQIHTGLIVLNGFPNQTFGGGVGPYVNLSSASGPASVGQVMPLLGTDTTGLWSQNSVGFTIEMSVKLRARQNWAKVMDLGAARTSNGGNCNGDLVFGWTGDAGVLEFETCTDGGSSSNRMNFLTNTVFNTWYHFVIVVQQTYVNEALAIGYLNGQQVVNMSMAYPYAEYRRDAALGRSNWNDNYINATYDLFRVYNQALNPMQVLRQYGNAFSVAVNLPPVSSSSSSSALPAPAASSSSAKPAAVSSSSSAAAAVSSASSSSSAAVAPAASSSSSAAVRAASSSSSAASVVPLSSSAATTVRSSSSSAAAVVAPVSSSAAASSSSAAAVPVRVSSSSSSSAPAVVRTVSSSSSSAAVAPPQYQPSSSSSVAAIQSSIVSSSSSSTAGPPIISTSGAFSTAASLVALVVCTMVSLALML